MTPEHAALVARLDTTANGIAFQCWYCSQHSVDAKESAAAIRALSGEVEDSDEDYEKLRVIADAAIAECDTLRAKLAVSERDFESMALQHKRDLEKIAELEGKQEGDLAVWVEGEWLPYPGMIGKPDLIMAKMARDAQDATRWRRLMEQTGHFQDGSDTTVTLMSDDATRSRFIKIGNAPPLGTDGSTFESIVDTTLRDAP